MQNDLHLKSLFCFIGCILGIIIIITGIVLDATGVTCFMSILTAPIGGFLICCPGIIYFIASRKMKEKVKIAKATIDKNIIKKSEEEEN